MSEEQYFELIDLLAAYHAAPTGEAVASQTLRLRAFIEYCELEATWEEHKFVCDRCYWKYVRESDKEAECERGESFRAQLEKKG